MLAWPHRANGWKGDMAPVDAVFVELIQAAAQYQRVLLVCKDEALRDHATALLQQAGVNMQNCLLRLAPTNDVWMRDAGPIGVIEGDKLKLLDFRFNAWGGKYSSSDDDQINRRLAEQDVFACECPVNSIDTRRWQHRKQWRGQPAHHAKLFAHDNTQRLL